MYPGTWAARTPDKPAHVLHDAGLGVGDVVALLSDNRPEAYEAYWAALRSGLYITAVNHNLSAEEVSYIVRDCGAKALLVSPARTQLMTPLADHLDVEVPTVLTFGGDYEDALAAASAEPLAEQPHGDDLLCSSGTTGRPKGIKPPLPPIAVDEPGYVYHAAPLRFGGVIHTLGGTLVMMEKFDAEGALRAIERHRVTHTQMVPTMFVRMLKLPDDVRASYDVSSLRVVVHAAAPCPVDVKRRMIEWFGPIVHEYYASTESNGATFIDSQAWLEKPGSVGTALMGIIRICGDDGSLLGPGEVGTVYFELEQRTFSYHNDPEKTASTQHPEHDSWTTVGDLGYMDEDGYLFLTDRKAFMIISGGVNIYPQEIEDLFSLHPAVTDIAVIGVPDDEMGERVVAFVEAAPGVVAGDDLAAELTAYARDHIAHFKVPREFHFRDELPRTPTGKMVKGRLRKEYAAAGFPG